MSKKLGLCVCYDTKNYGSQLQVLATLKVIEKLDYDYEIIRFKKNKSISFIIHYIPRFFNPYFIKVNMKKIIKSLQIRMHYEIYKKVKCRNNRFDEFVNKHFLKNSKCYNGYNELVSGTSNYDGFLVGSDQLWLPSNMGSKFYNLLFVPDKYPKISYATSFGVSKIPWFQKKKTAYYLNRFNHLSTRELRGSEIIKELTGKDAKTVLDPTLLFNNEEWKSIIPHKKVVSDGYIFCFFLGTNREHRKFAIELKNKTGYRIVTIPFLDSYVKADLNFGDEQLYDVAASDFVNLIRNAEIVLTDSFHCTVFSILNHKKFVVFNRFKEGRDSRNSRIESICTLLSLENYYYNRNKVDIDNLLSSDIDFKEIEQRLDKLRRDSISFLSEALSMI